MSQQVKQDWSLISSDKVPLHLHQKAKALPGTSSLQIMLMLLVLTGHGVISAPNRLHHFLGEGPTDHQELKFKQTTEEGKY